jgi:phage repressor protein C with HTH and peptisase S24 domain
MKNDIERIKMFLDHIKLSKNAVGLSIGDKNGMRFQHVLSGRNEVSEKLAKDIIDVYPGINYTWLLTGEGEMLKENFIETKDIALKNFPEKKTLAEKQFKELKKNEPQQEVTGWYHPNVGAAAGMDKEMVNDELKRIPISLPNWEKGIDFINVYGDSMYPKFCSGEIIGIKEVELQYLNFGFAYVVILKDEQVLLKFIKKSKKETHIILESENKFYEPKEYHLDQIKKVFIIKGVITKTTM